MVYATQATNIAYRTVFLNPYQAAELKQLHGSLNRIRRPISLPKSDKDPPPKKRSSRLPTFNFPPKHFPSKTEVVFRRPICPPKSSGQRPFAYAPESVRIRAVAAAPQTPQLGGPTLPKGAPNCLEGPEVASIQKQSFAWRIAFNGIFCAQILYISVLKFFAIVSFQIAS